MTASTIQSEPGGDSGSRHPFTRLRATRLLVLALILSIILIVGYLWFNPPRAGNSPLVGITFDLHLNDDNWSLQVVTTRPGLSLDDVKLNIYDANGSIRQPMFFVQLSNLTQANWTYYNVLYQKVGTENEVRPGAIIRVYSPVYPAGSIYDVSYQGAILAKGQFS